MSVPPVQERSVWNSLEVAKLIASLFMPLVVLVAGAQIQQQIARQDLAFKAQTRLADRRLAVYDEIRNDLNRIFGFVEDVGSWKNETPDTIVGLKRKIEATMYTNEAIWTHNTFEAFREYMDSAFQTYNGVGVDAKIRTSDSQKATVISGWTQTWSERLAPPDPEHRSKYGAMMRAISSDLMLEGAKSL